MNTKFTVNNLSVFYGEKPVLKSINLDLTVHEITGIIGPANSGKSTFLRVLNRLIDLIPQVKVTGKVYLDGKDIYDTKVDVVELRRKIGIVFALPIPLPMSIYDNLIFGLKLTHNFNRTKLNELVETSLHATSLWEEVKDRLNDSALRLSGGQQQRLCISRTLVLQPEVLLLDEPCSGLDPISTAKIEENLVELKKHYTIILVTNNTKQAARVSDKTAFFLMGELIEFGLTNKVFTVPTDVRTEEYITGKFG